MENLGKMLREMRKQRGLTQERLAQWAQVTARTLRSWETNQQQPREVELENVLTALKATPQEKGQVLRGLTETRSGRLLQSAGFRAEVSSPLLGDLPGIGDLLRAMRLRKGWTQERFAEAMKVSRNSVLRWEATRNLPSENALEQICLLLNALPEEKAALYAGRLLTNHWSPHLTLDECHHQYDLIRQIHNGNNALMPLTDLYALSLKRQIRFLLPQSPEALELLTKVEIQHSWWHYMQGHTAEACAGSSRLLKMAQGNLTPDSSWVGALNLLSGHAASGVNGAQNALRLLSLWLKMLPERFHY